MKNHEENIRQIFMTHENPQRVIADYVSAVEEKAEANGRGSGIIFCLFVLFILTILYFI